MIQIELEKMLVVKEDIPSFLEAYGLKLETVTEVNLTGENKPVWDVTVNDNSIPVRHTFVADGFVTHNSTDATYLENMMAVNHIGMPISQIFGMRDPKTQKWAILLELGTTVKVLPKSFSIT